MKSLFLRLLLVFCLFTCPLFVFAQLPSYLPADGLVAWYPFNGNANDESGNGYNGQAQGAILTSNRFGNSNRAYSFNGNLDNITTSLQQTNISSYTVSAWFKTNHGGWILTGRQVDSGDHSIRMLVNIDGVTAGGYGVLYGTDGDGNTDLTTTVANYNDNQWHHAVGVWDGVNSSVVSQFQMKLYIDGALVPQTPGTSVGNGGYGGHPNIPISGNSVCRFGISPGNYAPQSLVGQLDDIAIYNRALTAAEVTSLYTATAANTDGGNTTATPVPPGIPYQAEVRNESGEVLANANVNVRFTLHELTANGTVSYQETHAITTNELGLFAATIGAGTATQGTFAGINWSQTTKFLQVEVDTGSGYITMGNQQLMSVPYALYAANGPAGPQGPAGADGQPGPQGPQGESGLNQLLGPSAPELPIGTIIYWDGQDFQPIPPPTQDALSLKYCGRMPLWGNCPSPAFYSGSGGLFLGPLITNGYIIAHVGETINLQFVRTEGTSPLSSGTIQFAGNSGSNATVTSYEYDPLIGTSIALSFNSTGSYQVIGGVWFSNSNACTGSIEIRIIP